MHSARLPVSLEAAGLGIIQALPVASTNGTALPTRPTGAQGILLILGPNDSVTLTYRTAAQGVPTGAPAANTTANYTGNSSGTGDVEVPQFFTPDLGAYITAATAGARFRWM